MLSAHIASFAIDSSRGSNNDGFDVAGGPLDQLLEQERSTSQIHCLVMSNFIHGLSRPGFSREVDHCFLSGESLDEAGLIP